MSENISERPIQQRGPTPADYMNLMNKIPSYSGEEMLTKPKLG